MPINPWNPQEAFARLERAVANRGADFSATYMLVGRLGELIPDHPACASTRTVGLLADLMDDRSFAVYKQSYFLYRSVAETLAAVLVHRSGDAAGRNAMDRLKRVAESGGGIRRRAAAEALGSMPLAVSGPGMPPVRAGRTPEITYPRILARKKLDVRHPPVLLGRSLVAPLADGERVFVVKLARDRSDGRRIGGEAAWMDYLTGCGDAFSVPFHIPRPLTVSGRHVFSITHLPVSSGQRGKLPPLPCCAMGYIARTDYFAYPNDHRPGNRVDAAAFSEIIFRISETGWFFPATDPGYGQGRCGHSHPDRSPPGRLQRPELPAGDDRVSGIGGRLLHCRPVSPPGRQTQFPVPVTDNGRADRKTGSQRVQRIIMSNRCRSISLCALRIRTPR